MSAVYTVKGYAGEKALYRIEFTDSKAAAVRGAKEILALNPGIDRAEISRKRTKKTEVIRRMG